MTKHWKRITAVLLSIALLTGCGSAAAESKPTIDKNLIPQASTEKTEKPSEQTAAEAPQVPGEIYDAGEVQALVPNGWKVIPIVDVFSESNELEKDAFNICKGGESDMDLFTKPYIRFDYFGPDTEMMKPTKDWYSNTEDVEEFQAGTHKWSGFTAEEYGGKLAILWAEEEGGHQYQANVWLEVEGNKISLDDEDVLAILASVQPSDGTAGSNAASTEASGEAAVNSDYWAGDWYGWWAIRNGSGIYQEASDMNLVWDSFAEIQTNGSDIGHLTLWDTETSKSFALISAEIAFEASGDSSIMVLQNGTFFYGNTWLENFPIAQMNMEEGSWRIDPNNSTVSHFDHMIEIVGRYVSPENPEDFFDYYIYLRPWGTLWDDVREGDTSGCLYSDMMPLYHDNWYVSLLNLGYEQSVASFQEGIDIINDYLANDGSENSNQSGSAGSLGDKASADGIVPTMDAAKAGLEWCKTERSYSSTYDEVAAQFGVHGKYIDTWDANNKKYVRYRWFADEKNYVTVTFEVQPDGSETWNVTAWDGFK